MFQTAWNTPFYTGVAVSVDTRFDVSIGGHPYMIDWKADNPLIIGSIPLQKPQADTSDRPGEQTLNPEGLWRRAAESWHHGAGQEWYDRGEAPDPYRFRDSRGVNPWDRGALTLLNGVTRTVTSANTNLPLTVAGGQVYVGDGPTVRVSPDGVTWTALTGGGTGNVLALTSDGSTVYAAYATTVHTTTGGTLASFDPAGTAHVLRYASGRLWGGEDVRLYTWDAEGAHTELFAHPNPAWRWDDIAGAGWVYAIGHAGDRAAVYKSRESTETPGELTAPVVCGQLPDGELGQALCSYLGYLVIGTTKGVRLAQLDASGDLTIGALIEVGGGVRAFEPQGQFVWFTWANPDSSSTGLGRLDLTVFVAPLAPAYATDLQAPTQGFVPSVVTVADKRVFTVAGSGVWAESAVPVASGWMRQGRVTFGIPANKTAMSLDVRHLPLPVGGSVGTALSADDSPTNTLMSSAGVGSVTTPYTITTGQTRGSWFEPTITLTGGASLTRLTIRADPQSERTTSILNTILLHDNVLLAGQTEHGYHPVDEHTYLTTLRDSRQIVNFQCGTQKWAVVVEDTQFTAEDKPTGDGSFFQGSLLLRMKVVA